VSCRSPRAKIVEAAAEEHAGVVHEDVDLAERAGRFIDARGERGGVGAVDLQRQCAPAFGFDAAHEFVGRGAGTRIAEGDGGAVLDQAAHDRGADAARTAGDESSLAREDGRRTRFAGSHDVSFCL
jgi:hypothetical protein